MIFWFPKDSECKLVALYDYDFAGYKSDRKNTSAVQKKTVIYYVI